MRGFDDRTATFASGAVESQNRARLTAKKKDLSQGQVSFLGSAGTVELERSAYRVGSVEYVIHRVQSLS